MKTFKTPTKQRYLSPQEYLKDVKLNQQCNNIEQVKFIPPQIGKPGFGKFLVKYKMPVLV
ncbi:hypothetical protein HYE54_12455 [Aggregatibacter actinomycetemcomitans]|uniref:hypothetical protein n=1 Tax=Aggregatibacter actinomycetemcomitans TaxID=714 RepID=UPI00197C5FFD|nr:hypothetical protein [Aggregatibacter actinomycetemcomitans]MBN6068868.1 hypothetical protein [Aggregatibacter actinomycetemcomitans]MBN6068954.1 hypothetical protein [Aggregatibacter actinomycetemcomitans]MBN6069020.1 hypothetical protein [Aggregatibacter actinomycetemcomitans]MBN6069502.1 hypothetical protein [Aggregatibacter actinomycetemcomitans]MBN6086863.1 hypothetical protein [Aggregatibacter actinomycetemcomitans]